METRHPVEIYVGREFPAICYYCGVLAAWSRQNWNIFEKFLRFFGKTTPDENILKILFGKFTSRHRSTLLSAKFVKIVRREISESVRYSCDQKQKQNIGSLSNCRYCTDRAQGLHGQPSTFGSQSSKFHPNRFTFGGVIAGRVKAVKTRLKAFPMLGEAIASRRVMKTLKMWSKNVA